MKLHFVKNPAKRPGSYGARRRGAVTVEAALVLPVFLLFLFGILEYGRYLMVMQVMTNAAREGTHYALSHTQPVVINSVTAGNATSDVTNAVTKALGGQQLSGQTVSVYNSDSLGNNIGTWTNTQAGGYICVKITGNFPVIIPRLLFLPSTIPVSVQSVMRCESS
jgi:Flp pilus assembly protein TadG